MCGIGQRTLLSEYVIPSIIPLIPSSNYSTEKIVINADNVTFPNNVGPPNQDPWGTWKINISNYQTVQVRNGTNLQCGISFINNNNNQEVLYTDIMPGECAVFYFPVPVQTLQGRFSYLAPTMQLSAPGNLIGILEIFTSSILIPQARSRDSDEKITVPIIYALPTGMVFFPSTVLVDYTLSNNFTGVVAQGGTPNLSLGPFNKAALIPSADGVTEIATSRGFVANNANSISLSSNTFTANVVKGVAYPLGDGLISIRVNLAGITLVAECDVIISGMTTQITDP